MPQRPGRSRSRRPFGSRLLGSTDQSPRSLRIRLRLLLFSMLIATNVIGAAVVVLISLFVVPSTPATHGTVLAFAIAVPVYVVLAVLVGGVQGLRSTERVIGWALADREPDERERRAAMAVPMRLTRLQVLLWAGATVLFTMIAVLAQPERAVTTALTIAIATAVVGGVAYLLTEFALRPIAARALAGDVAARRPRGMRLGARILIFWGVGTAVPVIGLMITAVLALTDSDTTRTRLAVSSLVIGAVVLVFGFFISLLSARAVVAPVLSVRDALRDVEQGDFERTVAVYDGTELGMLQAGFNRTVTGLREREQLRDLFGRHVGRDVARMAASTVGEGEEKLGSGTSSTVSVLFVDLVGSTTYATEHTPEEVVAVLNRFFSVVVTEVDQRHGLVNKFIGDAVLAVFGAPIEVDDHAGAALEAARVMAARLAEEVPEVGAGIGVATGAVVAGNVGHESRFEYTVIGDAVNSAARITDLAKSVDGKVLADWASIEAATDEEAAHWERHGEQTLRGRGAPTQLAAPVEAVEIPAADEPAGEPVSAGEPA